MPEAQIPARIKQQVAQRARGCCEYCRSQVRFALQSFSTEHIVPRSRGGETVLDNLALACQGCNNHKYNRVEGLDRVSGVAAPIFHPRRDRWGEHFAWNDDFTLIIGVTPTGRATVETLQLNRSGLIRMRQVLFIAGEHPPSEAG